MSGAVMLVMALLPGIPMLPFLLLGGGAGALAYVMDKRQKAGADGRSEAGRDRERPAARRADRGGAQDRRSQDRARLCAAAAGQCARRRRPPDRADQGAAPLARDRDGLRDAGGAHPRQRPARGQQLRHQDQGGRRRHRQGLAGPVHGHGPDRRAGEAARPAHHRADLRPARDLGRRRAEGRSGDEGLHGGRRRDRAVDASHRAAQGQHRRAAVLCRGAEAHQGTAEGAGRAGQGHRAGADHHVGHPARAADCCSNERVSIRDLATILEGIADALSFTRNPIGIAEHVRDAARPPDLRPAHHAGAATCR